MTRVSFAQLLDIYEHTSFDPDGCEGLLKIDHPIVLRNIVAIDSDQEATDDSGITVLDQDRPLRIGDAVRISASAPKIALGFLVRDFETLLKIPSAQSVEPTAYLS